MEKPRMLIGNALAGFLDAGMGAFIAAATLWALGTEPALWHLPAGAALALLPDFDILPAILRMREVNGNHRATLLHRPLLVIPAAALAAFLLGGPAWGLAALLCVLWHFAHDTPPLSQGGIAWLWPFDSRYWSLKGPAAPHAPTLSHRAWIEKHWLALSPLLLIELGAGVAALALAFLIASRPIP